MMKVEGFTFGIAAKRHLPATESAARLPRMAISFASLFFSSKRR